METGAVEGGKGQVEAKGAGKAGAGVEGGGEEEGVEEEGDGGEEEDDEEEKKGEKDGRWNGAPARPEYGREQLEGDGR